MQLHWSVSWFPMKAQECLLPAVGVYSLPGSCQPYSPGELGPVCSPLIWHKRPTQCLKYKRQLPFHFSWVAWGPTSHSDLIDIPVHGSLHSTPLRRLSLLLHYVPNIYLYLYTCSYKKCNQIKYFIILCEFLLKLGSSRSMGISTQPSSSCLCVSISPLDVCPSDLLSTAPGDRCLPLTEQCLCQQFWFKKSPLPHYTCFVCDL